VAIAVIYTPPAMTAEQYKASWGGGAPMSPPPGLIFHAGMGEGAEFTTVTVWESRAAYDEFVPTFNRVMGEKGLRFGSPRIVPVHHVLAPDRQ
jgi:hypothetical protein